MPGPSGEGEPSASISEPKSPVASKGSDGLSKFWRRLVRRTKLLAAIVTTISTIAVVIWTIGLIASASFERHKVELRTITVPKSLADVGYTDQVVTQRLADEIHFIQGDAHRVTKVSNVELLQDATDFTIPKAGISVDSVAAVIRRHVPDDWKHEVSGELTSDGAGLSMRLRMNGHLLFSGTAASSTEVDTLVRQAAVSLVERVDPFIAESAWFNYGDLRRANILADKIIDSSKPGYENLSQAIFVKGMIAVRERRYADAESIFNQVPNRSLALYGIGFLRETQGRLDESARAFRDTLNNRPLEWMRSGIHTNLGDILDKLGNEEAAMAEFRKATTLDPMDSTSRLNLALLLQRHGKIDDAISVLREASQQSPYDPDIHVQLGNIWADQDNDDEAIDEYQLAMELDAKRAAPHTALGNLWDKQGKEDDASAQYKMAMQLEPENAEPHLVLGNLWEKLNRLDEATAEYQKANHLKQSWASPHVGLGNVSFKLGNMSKALAEYQAAVRLDRNSAEAHNGLGNVWHQLGKDNDAITEYQMAIKLDQRHPEPHMGLGFVWKELGKNDDAIVEYRIAMNLDRRSAAPHVALGNVWFKQGKDTEAIDEYRLAIHLDPSAAEPHINLGMILSREGKIDEAIAEYQSAILIDRNFADPHVNLGSLWLKRGKEIEAVNEFETAIQLDPSQAQPHFNLGVVDMKLARAERSAPKKLRLLNDACEQFEQGAKLAPRDLDYVTRMQSVDLLLPIGRHCRAASESKPDVTN